MNFLEVDDNSYKLSCITCLTDSTEINFRLLGIERSGIGYNCRFECPECYSVFAKKFDNFSMRKKLLLWLTTQGIIGKQLYKSRISSLSQWYYPWSDELRRYDFSEPKRFRRDQNNNWVVV
jgi:hypothetical protein